MSVHKAAGAMPDGYDNDKRCQRRHFNDKNCSNIFFGEPKDPAPAEEPEVNEDPEDDSCHPVETGVSEDTPEGEASDDLQDPEAEEDPAEDESHEYMANRGRPLVSMGDTESGDTKEPDVTEPEQEPEVIETPQDRNAFRDPFEHAPVSSDFKKKKSFFN